MSRSARPIHVPRKAYLGAKMAVFGPNILIILGGQKFWYPHIRKPPRHLVHIVFFGREWHIMDQIKTNDRSAKKSSPTPVWGHRLPITALALSARGLNNNATNDNNNDGGHNIVCSTTSHNYLSKHAINTENIVKLKIVLMSS